MKIGIITDIHEDIESLKKALNILESAKVDEIVCLGDITGFSPSYYTFIPDAKECIRLVKSNCKIVIAGNHDLFTCKKLPEYNAGFEYSADWFRLDREERKARAGVKVWDYYDEVDPQLNDAEIDFLKSLPEFQIFEAENRKIMFSHFCYPDLSGSTQKFATGFLDIWQHLRFCRENTCNISFTGHGHFDGIAIGSKWNLQVKPFEKLVLRNKLYWIGCPCIARGNHESGVSVYDTINNSIEVIPIMN